MKFKIKKNWIYRLRLRWEKCQPSGCIENPADERDHMYRPESSEIKDKTDLTGYLPRVRYQGSAPSCVGFGIIHSLMVEISVLSGKMVNLSASWAYYWARWFGGGITTPLGGAYIRNGFKGIHKRGCPKEKFRKYSTSAAKLNSEPTFRQSFEGRDRLKYRYRFIGGDRLEGIRQALSNGHPVVFRTKVTDSLSKYRDGQVLHRPSSSDNIRGGHCMVIVGHYGDRFLVLNSWRGREFVWFHEDYIDWRSSNDFGVWDIPKEKAA